jgi:hypothetical protein
VFDIPEWNIKTVARRPNKTYLPRNSAGVPPSGGKKKTG